MTKLGRLQSRFLNSVLDTNEPVPPEIQPSHNMNAAARFKIYQDAYRLRLVEALAENYPALHTITGDDWFEEICLAYIDAHPSRHFSIRYFGHEMPGFLRHRETPLLAEMAQFEWAIRYAFDGPNAQALTMEDLSKIPAADWPELVFQLLPTCQRITLQWNVPQLWQAAIQNEAPVEPVQHETPIQWIIWRPELETHFRSLDAREADLLAQLEQQVSFSQLCDSLVQYDLAEPQRIMASYLNGWIENGLLSRELAKQTLSFTRV